MALEAKFMEMGAGDILRCAQEHKAAGWRFVQLLCTNTDDGVDVQYSYMKDQLIENWTVKGVSKEDHLPSITGEFLAAFVFENESHDLFGVQHRQHRHRLRRQVLRPGHGRAHDRHLARAEGRAREGGEDRRREGREGEAGGGRRPRRGRRRPRGQARGHGPGEGGEGARGDGRQGEEGGGPRQAASADAELEAKLAGMDPEKAAKVRAAMEAKKARAAAQETRREGGVAWEKQRSSRSARSTRSCRSRFTWTSWSRTRRSSRPSRRSASSIAASRSSSRRATTTSSSTSPSASAASARSVTPWATPRRWSASWASRSPTARRCCACIWHELSRIHSHILWMGLAADAFGFESLFMHCWRLRERVLDLFEATTGGRVIFSVVQRGRRRSATSTDEQLKQFVDMLDGIKGEYRQICDTFLDGPLRQEPHGGRRPHQPRRRARPVHGRPVRPRVRREAGRPHAAQRRLRRASTASSPSSTRRATATPA